MLINKTIDKKILETIVRETFSQFGLIASSSLLDSLKLLGFYYATNAGISINIEDLKTPVAKTKAILEANKVITSVSQEWERGNVSDSERFQKIIDSWNYATESLKNTIIEYYQSFDPANNLYIMAFSGARGNMNQVRQLVGMRGLMSDKEGKIIDLPIQANFREGLSSIDYIISSYGARKGIVDTALKTADSGYLTRRLIYLAQDLIIREENCKSEEGVIFLLTNNTNVNNLIGRTLISRTMLKPLSSKKISENIILTSSALQTFKKEGSMSLNVRSSLTCKSNGSICQSCYGWDLAHNKLVSLGEAVGIIAAQSIGEPGTQLTMRTFHTGGIFTSGSAQEIVAPFSGKIIIPTFLNGISSRNSGGDIVIKLQQEARLPIISWKGIEEEIFLEIGSYLYVHASRFIRKGEKIAEYSNQSVISNTRRLKPIYTSFAGEIKYENLLVRKLFQESQKKVVKINQEDGVLWIRSGKIFPIPKEVEYKFSKSLAKNSSFARLKVITPYEGIITTTNLGISITNNQLKINIDLFNLIKVLKNCTVKFSSIVKNYQYVDKYTVLGFLEIYPNYEGFIYSIRKKETKYTTIYFLITESDVWKINSDQVNNFEVCNDKKFVRSGQRINNTSVFTKSGFLIKKDGFQMVFQNAAPIFLTRGTILNYKQGDFVLEKKVFATLLNYSQQTEDIVQGLPKIEELVEARRPKTKASLSIRPGILINYYGKSDKENKKSELVKRTINQGIIKCVYKYKTFTFLGEGETKKAKVDGDTKKKKQEKKLLNISHSLFLKDEIIVYNNCIFKAYIVPSVFQPVQKVKNKKDEFVFKNDLEQILLFYGKAPTSVWTKYKSKNSLLPSTEINPALFKYKNEKLSNWITLSSDENSIFFKNQKNDYIVKTDKNKFIFLEYLNPIKEYELPLSSKVLFKPGNFIDIGEPLTEGTIDVHELLAILFHYHLSLDGILIGTLRSLTKFQLLLVNSIQSIYQSQGGVNISSKHLEIIVKQMTSKVVIKESGDTPLLPGEFVRISLMNEIYQAFQNSKEGQSYKSPSYEPVLLSATNSSLSKDGFLSSAGFQETKRVLTKAAIEGSADWLRGLKECIIIGRLIPAGSSFLNYKHYLDNIYLFKDV